MTLGRLTKLLLATHIPMKQLAPCPSSPNCVSTQAHDEGHAITPFRYRKSRAEAKEALKEVIRSL
jgi:uncharacterized protein (DUF1499 family)